MTPTPHADGARRFLGKCGAVQQVGLHLAGVPAQAWVRVTFDLLLVRTRDGDSSNGDLRCGGDRFAVGVAGGPTPLDASSSHGDPPGRSYGPGPSNAPTTGAAESRSLGHRFDDGVQRIGDVQDAARRAGGALGGRRTNRRYRAPPCPCSKSRTCVSR